MPKQRSSHPRTEKLREQEGKTKSQAISILPTTGTGQRSAAQAGQSGQNHTGRTATIGGMETTIESKFGKGTTSHYHGGWRSHVTYITPEEEEKLCILMNRHREDKKWLSKQGGAILRRILHLLREQPREEQTDHMNVCLRRLTTGHQNATAAWIWQSMGLTWDLEMRWTTEYKRASHRQPFFFGKVKI